MGVVASSIKRFDVYLINLDPARGSEIKKTRPAVVISPDEMNVLKTVLVAPMTTQGFAFISRIKVKFLNKEGLIVLDQMRAVDRQSCVKRLGKIGSQTSHKILAVLQEMFSA